MCLKELLSDLAHFIPDLLRNQSACFARHTALCCHSSLTHTLALVGAVGYSSVSAAWRYISLFLPMFLPWHLSLDSLPEDVSPELFAVDLSAIPVPSDYLAHGDGDQ